MLLKSPFEKGDLGGFENLQAERIYGKDYNLKCQEVAMVGEGHGPKSPQDSGTGVDSGAPSTHRRFSITKVLKPNHR